MFITHSLRVQNSWSSFVSMNHLVKIGLIFLTLSLFSCRQTIDFKGSNIELSFSQDTIYLDTVFTGIGSSTRLLKVYNTSNENMTIDRVYLARGTQSYYRMNVDGISDKSVENVEILAGDSAYVFIEISPDAQGATEMVYTDSIWFENGNQRQHVDLITAVWDAYYHFPTNVLTIAQPEPYPSIKIPYSILPCNEVWNNDKPHVIYGYAVVDSACQLTINPGTQVHFHKGGGLWIYRDGQLIADGGASGAANMDNPIVFQGDRLEPSYEWVPGQWGGVLGGIFMMRSSQANVLRNTIIKNATTGVRLDSGATLHAENVAITHSSRVNLYGGYGNANLENFLSGPAGVYGLYGLGGQYDAVNSTFLNTWSYSTRGGTAVGLSNYFEDGNGTRYTRPISAHFYESIIDGSLNNEVSLAIDQSALFDVVFRKSALTIEPNPDGGHYDLSDTTMFSGSELFFNGSWNYVPGPILPNSTFSYVPDSLNALIESVARNPNGPLFDIHGKERGSMLTLGVTEPL
jgi:hypothetical protein